MADFLANVAVKNDDLTLHGVSILEVKTRPVILDNIYNWQVFQDDQDILRFMQCLDQYENQSIDCSSLLESNNGKDYIFGNEVVQLSSNQIPRGLVELEALFISKQNDSAKISNANVEDLEEINLGSEHSPQIVYIGKGLDSRVRLNLIKLLRKYKHVFSWSYEDLKAYREDLFQHEIPLKSDVKPFRQKQRPINPLLAPKIQQELMKLKDAGIIQPIRHSTWVSNLVHVRKKNGDIRLCVDFINLNVASLKDNYSLPNMEAMLHKVTGCELLSMMDGFSGYNQVLVKESEKYKTAFTTPWGTYVYIRMPFGLINAGATF